jgi:peptide/nickel transport system permease protein
MGKLTLEAIFARNYPIVFTVLMFTSILTLIGTLVADIMYAAVDPRISFSNKK